MCPLTLSIPDTGQNLCSGPVSKMTIKTMPLPLRVVCGAPRNSEHHYQKKLAMSLKHPLSRQDHTRACQHVVSFRTELKGFLFTAAAFSQIFLLIKVDWEVFLADTYHLLKGGYVKGLE